MVKRLHTRQIRYLADQKGRHRKRRAKSFKTIEQAKTWASAKGMKNIVIKVRNQFSEKLKRYSPIEKQE